MLSLNLFTLFFFLHTHSDAAIDQDAIRESQTAMRESTTGATVPPSTTGDEHVKVQRVRTCMRAPSISCICLSCVHSSCVRNATRGIATNIKYWPVAAAGVWRKHACHVLSVIPT